MSAFPWDPEFDLGEFLGLGLNTTQIGYLAGALFLGLFGVAALRRAKQAPGFLPVVWIAIALALVAGTLLVTARGFPEEIPDFLRPWTEPNRLARAGAVLALLGAALVCLSGHWIRGALSRWICRVVGLVFAGTAVWLAAGWFTDEFPADVRPWIADTVITHGVIVLGLLFLAGAFWVRQTLGSPHARWANRAVVPPAVALAVILGWRWFGGPFAVGVDTARVEHVTVVLATVATATFLSIAAGAYVLRPRPVIKASTEGPPIKLAAPTGPRPLPVAMRLDERGQPVLPKTGRAHSGPAGA